MQTKLTIGERMKDLRVEKGLTLEALGQQTGLSRSALGNYESGNFKDISPFAITTLAQFYGVSTDYLLGVTELKNHPNAELHELHLSDAMLELLKSGMINNRLLCEMALHKDFRRLMVDIEVYVDRIASMRIKDLNTALEVTRAQLQAKRDGDENALDLRTIESAIIDEDEYFSYTVHNDIDRIIRDIREAHKDDSTTADDPSGAAMVKAALDDGGAIEGSESERQAKLFCAQLGINYSKLTREEFYSLVEILKKSKLMKSSKNMRGRSSGKKR